MEIGCLMLRRLTLQGNRRGKIMILKIENGFLVVKVALGFDGSLKFGAKFSLSDIEKLLAGEKKELIKISESEYEADSQIDSCKWGEDI